MSAKKGPQTVSSSHANPVAQALAQWGAGEEDDMELCEPLNAEIFAALSQEEKELLLEILRAIRTIRYGSVSLIFHEGRVVEITKTNRIRLTGRDRT